MRRRRGERGAERHTHAHVTEKKKKEKKKKKRQSKPIIQINLIN
jgi:hypothetical protein